MELNNRCQHKQIDWIGKDQGRCQRCGKVGHWFEDAKLVIWHQENRQPVAVASVLELEGSPPPNTAYNVPLATHFTAHTG